MVVEVVELLLQRALDGLAHVAAELLGVRDEILGHAPRIRPGARQAPATSWLEASVA